jgi:hypothetical protein
MRRARQGRAQPANRGSPKNHRFFGVVEPRADGVVLIMGLPQTKIIFHFSFLIFHLKASADVKTIHY